jgi:hypothetical protein
MAQLVLNTTPTWAILPCTHARARQRSIDRSIDQGRPYHVLKRSPGTCSPTNPAHLHALSWTLTHAPEHGQIKTPASHTRTHRHDQHVEYPNHTMPSRSNTRALECLLDALLLHVHTNTRQTEPIDTDTITVTRVCSPSDQANQPQP